MLRAVSGGGHQIAFVHAIDLYRCAPESGGLRYKSGRLKKAIWWWQAKIWCCAFDPTGEMLASGGAECAVRVWKVFPEPLY